jgi:hypothetical protein
VPRAAGDRQAMPTAASRRSSTTVPAQLSEREEDRALNPFMEERQHKMPIVAERR